MGGTKLYERLKRLKEGSSKGREAPGPNPSRAEEAASCPSPGERNGRMEGPHGIRTDSPEKAADPLKETFPGWRKISEYVLMKTTRRRMEFPEMLGLAPFFLKGGRLSARIGEELSVPPGRFFFFDIETTGLSGGAGNIAFLYGCARLKGKFLEITRLFLLDYPGEGEFLEGIASLIPEDAICVSYNGKCFDEQVLRTRFLMNGARFPAKTHIDLLYCARRLWRRMLPDCSLSSIEAKILRKKRLEDIPGAEVPEAYFEFLRNGSSERLKLVLSHNEEDVASLAVLLAYIGLVYSDPLRGWKIDVPKFGGSLLSLKREEGEILLERDFLSGSLESGKALSLHYKSAGNLEMARAIWEKMGEEPFALVELAKHAEHSLRQPSHALRYAEKALNLPLDPGARAAFEKRRARLIEKIERVKRKKRNQ